MGDNLSVYGEKNITYCLMNGLIETLIIHEDVFTDDLPTLCDHFSTELVIISNFLPEANQIKMGFGGKVGILRYPVEIPYEVENSDDTNDTNDTNDSGNSNEFEY